MVPDIGITPVGDGRALDEEPGEKVRTAQVRTWYLADTSDK
jgi:hypothetical protein